MMRNKFFSFLSLSRWLLVAGALTLAASAGAATLKGAVAAQAKTDKAAAASQKRINDLVSKTDDAANKYVQAKVDTESLDKFNKRLSAQVDAQKKQIASLQSQLDGIQTTAREVQPLMQKMVETLAQFVKLDIPFFLKQRTDRVNKLEAMLQRPDVTISEKYRRILEAYQIELEYGRTLDAYEGKIGTGSSAKTVEFLRLGRIALLYQTPDGKETGYWNNDKKQWVKDNSYAHDFQVAVRIAKKQGAPDLITVPVHAPVEGQS
jgi:hypothetical protein